jgi:hypothetical protein
LEPDLLLGTYLVKATAILTAAALLCGARPRPAPVLLVAVTALLFLVGLLWRTFPVLGFDYRIFWEAGVNVRQGQNPYTVGQPFLNPPTALPLFALFALAPFGLSFLFWTAFNVVACLLLLPLCQRVLVAQAQADTGRPQGAGPVQTLPPLVLLGLLPALLLSQAALDSIYLGQLGILEALALLAALWLQGRGRPTWAGVCLALATVKVLTLLPFLLLFLRRADWRTWVALPAAALALCLLTADPTDQLGRITSLRERIGELEAPGKVNDYSFQGTRSENMLGLDHALYRLGLRDRRAVRIGQYLLLAALGAWVAWQVLGKSCLPRPAAASLVALYSVVFLYHRNYDTLILALPFAYCACQARSAAGGRALFTACALAIVLVWYQDRTLLEPLQTQSPHWGALGRWVQAVMLPYPTWLVLLAMPALVAAARRAARSVKLEGPHLEQARSTAEG